MIFFFFFGFGYFSLSFFCPETLKKKPAVESSWQIGFNEPAEETTTMITAILPG